MPIWPHSFIQFFFYHAPFTIQTHHEWTLIVPPSHFYSSHSFQQSCVQIKRFTFVLCHIFQHHVQIWHFMFYICNINVQFQISQVTFLINYLLIVYLSDFFIKMIVYSFTKVKILFCCWKCISSWLILLTCNTTPIN